MRQGSEIPLVLTESASFGGSQNNETLLWILPDWLLASRVGANQPNKGRRTHWG